MTSQDPPPPSSVPAQAALEGYPARFGKYTLLRRLASGGMAELFLAIQRSMAGFEKLIVIKRILRHLNQDQAFIQMLLHEARTAATLSHPNIVQVFDVGEVDGTYYIAMEHVHGEDLRSIVRQMKRRGLTEFPIEHALTIILGTCAGLAYAHELRALDGSQLNIVHRDISPQNIVVTFSGDVKIVDFGIAKSDSKDYVETRSGKLKGKVPYMSPEQARGDRIDGRSDIFSAGVVLFELTTGKRLFKGSSDYETLKLICERDYPLPSQVRPGYPRELEDIVMRALEKDRDMRFQSAREMQRALEEFVRHHRLKVSSIELEHFMQHLFADKLEAQKQALLQGKHLADIIDLGRPHDSLPEMEAVARPHQHSAPAASRTVTTLDRPPRPRQRAMWAAITLLAAAMVAMTLFVVLHRDAPTPVAPAPVGALAVQSDPPGASISINGDLRAETTPATIAGLPLGQPLDVKLTKDGFDPHRESITLTDKLTPRHLEATLKRGSLLLELVVKPAGLQASVTLDGQPAPGPSHRVTAGEEHTIRVSAPSYGEQNIVFVGNPHETRKLEITLDKLPDPRAELRAPPRTTTGPVPTGRLNVGAVGGWCQLTVDGVPRGATPVAGLELPAGSHVVVCTPEGKRAISATVSVQPGGTTRFKFSIGP